MAQPDAEALENLFTDQDLSGDKKFTQSEWLYINDLNNLSYSSGQIKFDTQVNKDQNVIWADSYLAIPIAISGVDHALVEGDPVAWKTSVLSLINGVQVTTASGQSLVNDTLRVNVLNNLKLLLESCDDAKTNLAELQMWKDTSDNNFATNVTNISALTNTRMAGADPQPFLIGAGPALQTANPAFNMGLANRVQLFKSACYTSVPNAGAATQGFAAGVFTMIATIPLRFLHNFFAELTWPVTNLRFQITFNTPVSFNASAPGQPTVDYPLMIGTTANATTQTAIGIATNIPYMNGCRIYYRRIQFAPEAATKFARMLQSGFTKTIKYNVLDAYPSLQGTQNLTVQTALNTLISSATVAPSRLWVLALPHGQNSSQSIPLISRGLWSGSNVLINNVPFWSNSLQLDIEHFWQFETQTVAGGSKDTVGALLGYKDWVSNYHMLVFDISRYKERLVNPAEACNIQLQTTVTPQYDPATSAVTPIDICVLVERSQVCKFSFSSGETSVVIGSAATV